MFCEKCGAQLRDGAQFCSFCGAKVEEDVIAGPHVQPQVNNAFAGVANENPAAPVHEKVSAGQPVREQFPKGQPSNAQLSGGKFMTAQSPAEQSTEETLMEEQTEEDLFSDEVEWFEDATLPKGMLRDPKGNIMWNYSLDMIKNPFILHVFYKIFLSCGFGFGLIIALAFGSAMGAFDEAVGVFFVIFLGFGGGLSILATLVYFLNMSIGGSIYTVMHIMTSECIQYSLVGSESDEKSKERARRLMGVVNFLSNGISSSGLAIETNTYMVSDYREVKKITADRDKDMIRLKHNILTNRIYAAPHQYDFVLNYISSRCTGAKIEK